MQDKVIDDFGDEWACFHFLKKVRLEELSQKAAKCFPALGDFLENQNRLLVIGDFGTESEQWPQFLVKKASKLYVLEPCTGAFQVIRQRFGDADEVTLLNLTMKECEIPIVSLDLAVYLGVVHYTKNLEESLKFVREKLERGDISLCYLYDDQSDEPITS